jgi:hypothetical protein
MLDPGLYAFQQLPISVDLSTGPTAGRTFVDHVNGTVIRVATTVQTLGYTDLLAFMSSH